jgi:hypothetical protein
MYHIYRYAYLEIQSILLSEVICGMFTSHNRGDLLHVKSPPLDERPFDKLDAFKDRLVAVELSEKYRN